ncbi:transposase family protein [Streptomyces albus subsp. chlorinus]|nr:transposase family protein [Streptomyces albus subsp. chlorinus]
MIRTSSCATASSPSATGSGTAARHSAKRRRYGVDVHVVIDPGGGVLWISPALPGRIQDLTATRTRTRTRQGNA